MTDPEGVELATPESPWPPTHRSFITSSSRQKTASGCWTNLRREDLFRYLWGIIKNHEGHVFRLNGVEDHVHILTSLHPTDWPGGFGEGHQDRQRQMDQGKQGVSAVDHWQEGYGAFTHSVRDKAALIEYIKNQEEHHRQVDFLDEYRKLLRDAGIEFDEKYLL